MPKSSYLKSFYVSITVIAVILLLIFFNFKGWLEIPKDAVYFVSSPFLKFFQRASDKISGAFSFLFTIKDLENENYFLKEENQRLLKASTDLKEIIRENELLRQRLGLDQPSGERLLLANVIGYDLSFGQYFLIDKGTADGLTPNLAAVTANNFLVGKTADVAKHSAKIILISDSNSSVNAIAQDSQINGVVKGSHGLTVAMEMIPADQRVSEGELVLSSGLDDSIPKDLIIGQITEIILKESEIFQKAVLRPAADFKKLESIFIILR